MRGVERPGDYNNHVLLLLDGHRLNDNLYDMALIGREFPVDMDLIERVEIIRGPSSSLYGTNAFFAVINVITRTHWQLCGFVFLLNHRVSPLTTDVHPMAAGTKAWTWSSPAFTPLKDRGLTMRGVFSAYEKRLPMAYYGTRFNDPRTKETYDRQYVDLIYQHFAW